MGVPASIFAASRFWVTQPYSPFRKRISSPSSSNYVMHVTDQNPRRSLRSSHDVLAECFAHGTLSVGLYIGVQGGRPRLLTRSDNVFRVFGLAVAAGGADHVR
jgi:hypothetical protein